MKRAQRLMGWSVVVALAAVPLACPRSASSSPAIAPIARLLGPLGAMAATVQRSRAAEAAHGGRSDLALSRGRSALALDPGATGAWMQLAWHLAFERGAPGQGPGPQRRLAWVRAGLDLAAQGEASAREPEELALWRGLVYARLAQEEPPPPWEGGAPELWRLAEGAFERAAALGHRSGADLARAARRSSGE